MIELTLAAAMQLRALLRASGVVGMPGVRVLPGPRAPAAADERLEIVVEDRGEPGDKITESRGIRFYMDPIVASVVGEGVLDLQGSEFVLRARV